jgi:hypothetical protein
VGGEGSPRAVKAATNSTENSLEAFISKSYASLLIGKKLLIQAALNHGK